MKMENASCIFWCVKVEETETELKVWKVVPYKDRQGIRNNLAQIRAAEIREEYSSGNQDDPNWALPYVGEVGWHAYTILREGEILVVAQNDESYGIASCAIVKDFTSQLRGHLEDHSVYNNVCRGRPCLMYDNFRSFAFDWTGKVIFRSIEREAGILKTVDGRPDFNPIQRECPPDIHWTDPNTYWIDRIDDPFESDASSSNAEFPNVPTFEVLSALPKHHCKCQISAKQVNETTFMEVGFDIPKDDSKFDVQALRNPSLSNKEIYHEIKSLWMCWLPPDMPTVQIHCQSRFEADGSLTFKFFIQDDTPHDVMPFRVFKIGVGSSDECNIGSQNSWYNENHKKLSYVHSVSPSKYGRKLWIYYGV
jgi:hypothetical protein